MHASPTPADPQILLALKRKIDAICDRFEQAWAEGKAPRIEDHLSGLAPEDRPLLFQELLSSELALLRPADPGISYNDYLARFPEYRSYVLEVFSNCATHVREMPEAFRNTRRIELINTLRQGLYAAESASKHGPQDQSDSQGAGPVNLPAASVELLAENLWDLLIRSVTLTDSSSGPSTNDVTSDLEAMQSLLNALPESRRGILRKLLLGQSIPQIARQHRVTERTVTATLEAAITLLMKSVVQR